MVKTLNIHLSCMCFWGIIPFSLLVLLLLTQGEGGEQRFPHPQRGRSLVRAQEQLLTLVCRHHVWSYRVPRVNGAPVFTLPVYKVSKAIIMTRNWRERAREETKGIYSVLIQTAFRKSLLVFSNVWEEKFIPKTKAWSSFLVSLDGSWCKCALDGAIIFFHILTWLWTLFSPNKSS